MRNFTTYKDFNYINRLIFNKLYLIPNDIDAIVAIPRSGTIIGNIIGEYLNRPVIDIYSIDRPYDNINFNPTGSKTPRIDFNNLKKILLVDDTVKCGGTIKNASSYIRARFNGKIVTLVVFSWPGSENMVDISLQSCEHYVPWNILKVGSTEACFDMDGVLCEEVPSEFDDDGVRYTEFIRNSRQLFVPQNQISNIVTSRLEKYRKDTEYWLNKNKIKYGKLIMLDLPNMKEKMKIDSGRYKGEIYLKSSCSVFVESSKKQAETIKRISGKPVFCTSTYELL